ncbi:LEA_2 domain-containing protein [Cephalotus follicularis]|uniref:LEA_2 domain-containing protein n=1 Tax=Cephalotus follicularis TaxID=3775 RepID=A0A1Q3AP45_CEPFO|nr:LEA_2 domain-containing protein [Cephalotus follicularis]
MASLSIENPQNQEPKKELTGQPPSDRSPPNPPPVVTGYPPVMGYPPPYQGYGHANGYNQYPHTQPPPAAYDHNVSAYQAQPPRGSSGFARGILVALSLLVVFACLSSIVTWIVLRPEIPIFHVDAFSVSGFNASTPRFVANWEANLTVDNPNTRLKVYVQQIQSFIYFDDDEILASSLLDPFSMDTKGKATIFAKTKTDGSGQALVEDLSKARDKGTMSFSLRFVVLSTFKSSGSSSWWIKHVSMRVYCEDLEVAFVGATGNGALAPGKAKDCLVFV